jgi:hypothetical protein
MHLCGALVALLGLLGGVRALPGAELRSQAVLGETLLDVGGVQSSLAQPRKDGMLTNCTALTHNLARRGCVDQRLPRLSVTHHQAQTLRHHR